jgi:DNA polymerase III subunit beta
MKITVNRIELIKAIEVLSSIAKENKIRPVLSGIKIEVTDKIVLQATDLENILNIRINGEIEEQGATVIIHNEIKDYLKELESEKITLQLEKGEINIVSDTGEIKISIFDIEEYPKIRNQNFEKYIEIESEKLINNINKVKFCMPLKSDNLAIFGIKIKSKENILHFSATDTYRMIMSSEKMEIENDIDITISRSAVDGILKFLKDYSGIVKISFENNLCLIETANTSFITRIIDLEFPDIFAIENNYNANINLNIEKDWIISSFKRIKSIVKNNTEMRNSAIFKFNTKGLEIKALSNKAKIKEKIDVIKSQNELKICLNVDYMINFLENAESVEWGLPENAQGIVRMKENDYRFYFMPLSFQDE